MIAVVPVRGGTLPLGATDAVAEAGGRALVIGAGASGAAAVLAAQAAEVSYWEAGDFAPGTWAASLVALLSGEEMVVLPASPDGRDLAPRIALELGWPLLAPAVSAQPGRVVLVRGRGLALEEVSLSGPAVVSLQPGVRGAEPARHPAGAPHPVHPELLCRPDAAVRGVLEADPATVDLAEARRVVGVGAGAGGAEEIRCAHQVAAALGASLGATRVVTDAGLVDYARQIGTTGVVIDPELYVSFGVSGAVQHVSGLGDPATVICVTLDPSCPMAALADLVVVTDAPALLHHLAGTADD